MTIGELEKRIKAIKGRKVAVPVEPYETIDPETEHPKIVNYHVMDEREYFLRLVEEAKQDFPTIARKTQGSMEMIQFDPSEGGRKPNWEQTVIAYSQLCIERDEWFKKWFGSDEVQREH